MRSLASNRPNESSLAASPDLPPLLRAEWDLPRITVSAQETPAVFVLLEAADQAGVSVVSPPAAESTLLTVDYRDAPAQHVFDAVGDLLGLSARFEDGVVSFAADRTARAVAVQRYSHEDPSQVLQAMQSVLGQDAKVVTVGSRVLVAGTREQISLASDLSRYLMAGPDGWRLDVRVVGMTETFRRELGLDWELGGQLQLAAGGSRGDFASVLSGSSASIVVRAIASATESARDAALLHSATLYLLEDDTATMHQGDRTPVPRYSTSPEGTTTLVGYDYVSTGFELSASGKRVDGGIRLTLEPSVSSVSGFVVDAPIVTQSRVTAQVVLASGEWVVISGLSTRQADHGGSGLPGLRAIGKTTTSTTDSSVVYLVRADRVYASGGVTDAE